MVTTKETRLTKELLDMSAGMSRLGILSKAAHSKITKRHLGGETAIAKPISGQEIKTLRRRSKMSQAVFAQVLNLTTGYVSQLERGAKRPTGAALVLLNVIRRKGIEAIL
jgi:putative transcriptional regulator